MAAADLAPVDLDDRALAVLELRRGELVGLRDRDDAVDAGGALEVEVRDVLAVADRADHGEELALETWAWAPTDSTRLTTGVDLLVGVASSFMTIII